MTKMKFLEGPKTSSPSISRYLSHLNEQYISLVMNCAENTSDQRFSPDLKLKTEKVVVWSAIISSKLQVPVVLNLLILVRICCRWSLLLPRAIGWVTS